MTFASGAMPGAGGADRFTSRRLFRGRLNGWYAAACWSVGVGVGAAAGAGRPRTVLWELRMVCEHTNEAVPSRCALEAGAAETIDEAGLHTNERAEDGEERQGGEGLERWITAESLSPR